MRYVMAMMVLIAVALLAAGAPPATKKAEVKYLSAKELQAAALKPGTRVVSEDKYAVMFFQRTGPGEAELHDDESDIFYIVDGSASFVTGGAIEEAKITAPGETRGKSIKGGQVHKLSKGDAITIPKKTPHWYKEVNGKVQYFIVKVRD